MQYAERLLAARACPNSGPLDNAEIAKKLVYEYKDHGFAIDAAESTSIFGPDVIIKNSPEYAMANRLHGRLDFVRWIVDGYFGRDLAFTGGCPGGAWVRQKPDDGA